MLMCNAGYKPATSQIFSGCSDAKLHVANMNCVRGYCDPAIFHRACFGVTSDHHHHGHHHHGHGHGHGHGHHHRSESVANVDVAAIEEVIDQEVILRRRRESEDVEDDATYSNETADEFGDVWFTKDVGRAVLVRTHLVCDLSCAPGMVPKSGHWVAKCDESNGNWAIPPTHCDNKAWTPKCNMKQVNGGYITCGHQQHTHGLHGATWSTKCHLHCHPGFSPRDPARTQYTCNFASGAFSPQPIGCKPNHLPEHPHTCAPPLNIGGGHWKCFPQPYDAPYPPHSRTEEWDKIEHVAPPGKKSGKPVKPGNNGLKARRRQRREEAEVDPDYFSDEERAVHQNQNRHTKVNKVLPVLIF